MESINVILAALDRLFIDIYYDKQLSDEDMAVVTTAMNRIRVDIKDIQVVLEKLLFEGKTTMDLLDILQNKE
jgi:hypothetical protein